MTETFTLLGGKLTLAGPHPAEDALWLAASVSPAPGSTVLDAMSGSGTVGLALSARCPGLAVTAVEIDPALAALATTNATFNKHANHTAHATNLATFNAPTPFNYALMNPPFHATTRGHATPNASKALAHGLPPGQLAKWLEHLHALTTPTGTIALIVHAACREEVLAFAEHHTCATTLQPLETAPHKPAKRLLVALAKAQTFTLAEQPPLPAHNTTLRNAVLHHGQSIAQATA